MGHIDRARAEFDRAGQLPLRTLPEALPADAEDVPGHAVIGMLLEDGEVRLVGRDAAVRRAQNLVSRYVPAGLSLADKLIEERRAEAARERS